jgi:hypothetical protein
MTEQYFSDANQFESPDCVVLGNMYKGQVSSAKSILGTLRRHTCKPYGGGDGGHLVTKSLWQKRRSDVIEPMAMHAGSHE